ncbi:hypothetical protein WN944_019747 [Citrus x changshan-huyou]|uniref:Uncharacterized protein n=1 Tax=Citrus x changshan-huyou TaxID=2935761 RepID=A0AAP0QJR9_9ROSI
MGLHLDGRKATGNPPRVRAAALALRPRSPPSDLRIQSQPLNEESQCSLLPLHEHINSLIDSIDSGHYLQALSSDAAKLVLDTLDFVDLNDSAECADRVYSALLQRVEAFIVNDSENDVDKACRVILLMCLSIAALFWFTQCNVTGPLVDNSPKCRFPLEVSTLEGNELIEWENWAHYQLMSVGSDLLGKFSYLQYIVFAKMLLMKTKDLLFDATVLPVNGIRTISWWLTRILLMHQRILDERPSSLYDLLKVFMAETLQHFGTLLKWQPVSSFRLLGFLVSILSVSSPFKGNPTGSDLVEVPSNRKELMAR